MSKLTSVLSGVLDLTDFYSETDFRFPDWLIDDRYSFNILEWFDYCNLLLSTPTTQSYLELDFACGGYVYYTRSDFCPEQGYWCVHVPRYVIDHDNQCVVLKSLPLKKFWDPNYFDTKLRINNLKLKDDIKRFTHFISFGDRFPKDWSEETIAHYIEHEYLRTLFWFDPTKLKTRTLDWLEKTYNKTYVENPEYNFLRLKSKFRCLVKDFCRKTSIIHC